MKCLPFNIFFAWQIDWQRSKANLDPEHIVLLKNCEKHQVTSIRSDDSIQYFFYSSLNLSEFKEEPLTEEITSSSSSRPQEVDSTSAFDQL